MSKTDILFDYCKDHTGETVTTADAAAYLQNLYPNLDKWGMNARAYAGLALFAKQGLLIKGDIVDRPGTRGTRSWVIPDGFGVIL